MGFRALVTAGKQQVEDKTPIHIADLQSMTEDFARRLHKKRPGSHDDDAGGVASTVVGEVTRPAEPEASSGRDVWQRAICRSTQQRKQRML